MGDGKVGVLVFHFSKKKHLMCSSVQIATVEQSGMVLAHCPIFDWIASTKTSSRL